MAGPSDRSMKTRPSWLEPLAALVLALGFLLPRLLSPPAFPLHDVGFNLHVLERLDAAPGPTAWLEEASRLRPERFYPLYWGIQHLLWRLGGRSLALFFPANLLLLALLLLGVGRLAARLGGKPWLAWFFLLASPGLVENVHTIMKQELLLACLEVWAWWALLSRKGLLAMVFLLAAGLLKETALFAAPAFLLLFAYQARSHGRRPDPLLPAGAALAAAVGVLALLARRPGPYTQAFSLSPGGMARALLHYLGEEGPLFLFLPGAFLLWTGGFRRLPAKRKESLLGTTLLFLFWAGGYLPWQLPQVRYLLPAFAFLAPLSASAWERRTPVTPWSRTGAVLFLAGAAVSFPWAASRVFREARDRLLADQAVSQALAFSARLPEGGKVYLLLPEDEPLLEFRFRLSLQEKRPDLSVLPALSGRKPGEWIQGLQSLAQVPPAGALLLVPSARGLPSFADRVFPVSADWSATLEQAVRTILGFVARPVAELGTFRGDFRAGFKVHRFQGPPKLDLLPPGGVHLGKNRPFQVEGVLPSSMAKSSLLLTVQAIPAASPIHVSWNGKTYTPRGKPSDLFKFLLPRNRPGPADPYHRLLGSQTLHLSSPNRLEIRTLTLQSR